MSVILQDRPGYEVLARILSAAYDQASIGKGHQRHGSGTPFAEQPMQTIANRHGLGFITGQIAKKADEVHQIDSANAQVHELLGVIVYAAGGILQILGEPGVNDAYEVKPWVPPMPAPGSGTAG